MHMCAASMTAVSPFPVAGLRPEVWSVGPPQRARQRLGFKLPSQTFDSLVIFTCSIRNGILLMPFMCC